MIFRPRIDGAPYATVIFLPPIVTELDMRGLSCAAHAVTNKTESVKTFRSCMAKPVYAPEQSIGGAVSWFRNDTSVCYNWFMAISARNQLPGTVEDIQVGDIMAHVVVKVGDNLVESVITSNSAKELGLKKGDRVKVVIKSTEVMVQKD